MTGSTTTLTGERADLLEALATHRHFLRFTVRGLTDEQATSRPTVSQLTLAGLIKHVAGTEATWTRFIEGGAEAMGNDPEAWAREWRLEPGQTLASVLEDYAAVAAHTDELVATLPAREMVDVLTGAAEDAVRLYGVPTRQREAITGRDP